MSYILDWGANFRGNLNLSPLQENLLKRVSPNVYNAYEASGAIFASKEKGTPKQLERALEYAKKMKAKYGDNLVKVSGHSLGGAEAIHVGSHLNLQVVAVDPAPVNNPGKYINNKKMVVIVPNNGRGTLNRTIIDKNGGKVNQFASGNEYLPKPISGIFNMGMGNNAHLPVLEVKAGQNTHEVDDEDMKRAEKELRKKMGWN